MNNTAIEDLFIREEELDNTSPFEVKVSGVRDWKRWGRDHSKDLGIGVWLENAKQFTAGAVEIKFVTDSKEDFSDDPKTTTVTASVADIDRNGHLAFFLLPRVIKQYVKTEVKVTTAFATAKGATAPVVTIGLENDAEHDIDETMLQPKLAKDA